MPYPPPAMHSLPKDKAPGLLTKLEKIEPVALACVAVITGGALAQWLFPALAAVLPPVWGELRAPTAVALLFVTLSFALSGTGRPPFAHTLATGVALGLVLTPCVGLLAALHVLPIAHDRLAALPPLSSVLLTLASFVGVLWNRESAGVRSLYADAGAAVMLASFLFLSGGYTFNGLVFTGTAHVSLESPPTILAIGLLTLVLVERRAGADGIFGFLVEDGIGSRIARAVLPAVALMPFAAFEIVAVLEHSGVSSALGRALVAPLLAIGSIAVVIWMGRHTNQIEDHLRQQSSTDQLTGLLNQRGFEDAAHELGRAARRNGRVTAFFFDLDNLKRANDLLGHTAGSQVIQRFADLLAVTFRKSDVIGRVGGDEFVVLAPTPVETAEDMLLRFARVVEKLNATEYLPMPISYSVGYAELAPDDARNLEDLIAEADARMYAEKSRKRVA